MSSDQLLTINNLSVDFKTADGPFRAVDNVTFEIKRGETMALVGESGSGKSVTALSILQLLPYPLASHPKESSITYEEEELIGKDDHFMRKIRGEQVSMIFQEPLTALNPLHTIEKQIGEMLALHQNMQGEKQLKRILELMDLVGMPKMKERLGAYPHELSGGQRQRVMIAMALANNPELLIADEPTTALDVTVQAQILDLLEQLKKELDMALLLITHDLGIVERMADHVCVMQNGQLVENGTTKAVFDKPQKDYTKMLLGARDALKPIQSLPKFSPTAGEDNNKELLKASNIIVHFPKKKTFFGRTTEWVKAVDDVSLSLQKGQTLGVVGESGSGKSTLAMALLKLQKSKGIIIFNDKNISALSRKAMRPYRSDMQVVFQDPFGSLSPRMSVSEIIGEGLRLHKPDLSKVDRESRIVQALKNVQMDPDTRHRYPHEFSGGQRQRISIARALVLHPEFIVLDEPTSALDVSVQAEIVQLLKKLQTEHNLTYLFISHDLLVVRAMSHDVLVMKDGKIVEHGPASDIFENPQKDYTKRLLKAALDLKAS